MRNLWLLNNEDPNVSEQALADMKHSIFRSKYFTDSQLHHIKLRAKIYLTEQGNQVNISNRKVGGASDDDNDDDNVDLPEAVNDDNGVADDNNARNKDINDGHGDGVDNDAGNDETKYDHGDGDDKNAGPDDANDVYIDADYKNAGDDVAYDDHREADDNNANINETKVGKSKILPTQSLHSKKVDNAGNDETSDDHGDGDDKNAGPDDANDGHRYADNKNAGDDDTNDDLGDADNNNTGDGDTNDDHDDADNNITSDDDTNDVLGDAEVNNIGKDDANDDRAEANNDEADNDNVAIIDNHGDIVKNHKADDDDDADTDGDNLYHKGKNEGGQPNKDGRVETCDKRLSRHPPKANDTTWPANYNENSKITDTQSLHSKVRRKRETKLWSNKEKENLMSCFYFATDVSHKTRHYRKRMRETWLENNGDPSVGEQALADMKQSILRTQYFSEIELERIKQKAHILCREIDNAGNDETSDDHGDGDDKNAGPDNANDGRRYADDKNAVDGDANGDHGNDDDNENHDGDDNNVGVDDFNDGHDDADNNDTGDDDTNDDLGDAEVNNAGKPNDDANDDHAEANNDEADNDNVAINDNHGDVVNNDTADDDYDADIDGKNVYHKGRNEGGQPNKDGRVETCDKRLSRHPPKANDTTWPANYNENSKITDTQSLHSKVRRKREKKLWSNKEKENLMTCFYFATDVSHKTRHYRKRMRETWLENNGDPSVGEKALADMKQSILRTQYFSEIELERIKQEAHILCREVNNAGNDDAIDDHGDAKDSDHDNAGTGDTNNGPDDNADVVDANDGHGDSDDKNADDDVIEDHNDADDKNTGDDDAYEIYGHSDYNSANAIENAKKRQEITETEHGDDVAHFLCGGPHIQQDKECERNVSSNIISSVPERDAIVSQDSTNEDRDSDQRLLSALRSNFEYVKGISISDRPQIPKIDTRCCTTRSVIDKVDKMLEKVQSSPSSLLEINCLIWAGAKTVTEHMGLKLHSSNHSTNHKKKAPEWKKRLQTKIAELHKDVAQLGEVDKGKTSNPIG
nr:protein PFC0760c-like [Lytechinus pictus]